VRDVLRVALLGLTVAACASDPPTPPPTAPSHVIRIPPGGGYHLEGEWELTFEKDATRIYIARRDGARAEIKTREGASFSRTDACPAGTKLTLESSDWLPAGFDRRSEGVPR
jgi:hypothetical protein